MAEKRKSTLESLRSIGKGINCVVEAKPTAQKSPLSVSHIRTPDNEIMKITDLSVDEGDELAEELIDEDDFHNVFFIAPIECGKLLEDEDEDGEHYWSEAKPKFIQCINELMGYHYGFDYAILRRGMFSLLAVLTTDEDDSWTVEDDFLNAIIPDCPDKFLKDVEYYARNTDRMFFPINAIVVKDKFRNDFTVKSTDREKVEVRTIQCDISFFRSESFHAYDSDEGRTHFTGHLFIDGLMHSLALRYRIISFDDELIDKMLMEAEKKHT